MKELQKVLIQFCTEYTFLLQNSNIINVLRKLKNPYYLHYISQKSESARKF